MSAISGIGGGQVQHVGRPQEAAPPVASQATASTGGGDALQALQGLLKQIESSANTRAIPAHQNW